MLGIRLLLKKPFCEWIADGRKQHVIKNGLPIDMMIKNLVPTPFPCFFRFRPLNLDGFSTESDEPQLRW
jgi:hypothetical protein